MEPTREWWTSYLYRKDPGSQLTNREAFEVINRKRSKMQRSPYPRRTKAVYNYRPRAVIPAAPEAPVYYQGRFMPVAQRINLSRQAAVRRRTMLLNMRSGGFLGIEYKFVDYTVAPTALTTVWSTSIYDPTPTILSLNATEQGVSQLQRDGVRQKNVSILIRGFFDIPAVASQAASYEGLVLRWGVFRDKQTNGAQTTGDLVMDASAAPDINGFRNIEYTKRFDILKDKTVSANPKSHASGTTTNQLSLAGYKIPFKCYLNVNDTTTYTAAGTAAAIAGIVDNSYHFFAICSNTGGGVVPTVTYFSRCRFVG